MTNLEFWADGLRLVADIQDGNLAWNTEHRSVCVFLHGSVCVCVCVWHSPPPSDLSPPANILMKVVLPVPADKHKYIQYKEQTNKQKNNNKQSDAQLTVLSQHHHDLRVCELSCFDFQRELAHRLLHFWILNNSSSKSDMSSPCWLKLRAQLQLVFSIDMWMLTLRDERGEQKTEKHKDVLDRPGSAWVSSPPPHWLSQPPWRPMRLHETWDSLWGRNRPGRCWSLKSQREWGQQLSATLRFKSPVQSQLNDTSAFIYSLHQCYSWQLLA